MTLMVWVSFTFLMISGACMLVGFLTQILSLFAAVECLAIAFSWFPFELLGPLESKLALVAITVIAASIALLGPGAFSLDARLFGWKEIVIPPSGRPPLE